MDMSGYPRLLHLIRRLDSQKIPMFGCCFGHQAIAKALGGRISKNRDGWSVGVRPTTVFRAEDWMQGGARQADLHSFHIEQIAELPPGCRVVGTSPNCPIASFARGDHVFTSQHHPEITDSYAEELVEDMAGEIGSGLSDARMEMKRATNRAEFAAWIAQFFEFANVSRITAKRGPPNPAQLRHDAALEIAKLAGSMANRHYRNPNKLTVVNKAPGDPVSDADKSVEQFIRGEINNKFPRDGIIGEEFSRKRGYSGYSWVIDPIDGTANLVSSIPFWCVSIACVRDTTTVVGVIHDPVHNQTFHCCRNRGAFLNRRPIRVMADAAVSEARVGIGISPRFNRLSTETMLAELLSKRIRFACSGSGALGLAHVAAGRLSGFIEEHQNAWDCLAGLLLVEEAGGIVLEHDPRMLDCKWRQGRCCGSLYA